MAIIAGLIPLMVVIVAAVSPVPVTFWCVVTIVAKVVIHQIGIEAVVVLWIQALAFIAVCVPVRGIIVAAVTPVPCTF